MTSASRSEAIRSLDPRRIAVIKPSALGDVCQSLPLARVLKRVWPAADVSWVINRELQGLLVDHPCLRETIPFDRRGGVRGYWSLLRLLRRRRFDMVFDLQGLLRSACMTWASGAPVRIGLETAREGSRYACTDLLPGTGRDVPAHQRYWRVAEFLGQGAIPTAVEITIPSADRAWVDQQLGGLPRPIIAVHAGAGWITKRWPPAKFAEALHNLPGSVVAVGSSAEIPLAAEVVAGLKQTDRPSLNLAGRTTLKQLAALLEAVDLTLSNDSGPLHLAAAQGTPVVGVYTCTSPQLSGPTGAGHLTVATTVDCAASYCRKCPHVGPSHMACLEELAPDRVRMALLKQLADWPHAG